MQNKLTVHYPTAGEFQGEQIPDVTIDIDAARLQGRSSQRVALINLNNGKTSGRFFVHIGVDSNNKPFVCLTAIKKTKEMEATVKADFLDFEKRMSDTLNKIV